MHSINIECLFHTCQSHCRYWEYSREQTKNHCLHRIEIMEEESRQGPKKYIYSLLEDNKSFNVIKQEEDQHALRATRLQSSHPFVKMREPIMFPPNRKAERMKEHSQNFPQKESSQLAPACVDLIHHIPKLICQNNFKMEIFKTGQPIVGYGYWYIGPGMVSPSNVFQTFPQFGVPSAHHPRFPSG